MEILIGLFIMTVVVVLYKIFTTKMPEESYLVPPKVKSKEKPIEEHFEDTLEAEDFIKKEEVAEVNDHVKEIVGIKPIKKHLQKSKRKPSIKVIKDK